MVQAYFEMVLMLVLEVRVLEVRVLEVAFEMI